MTKHLGRLLISLCTWVLGPSRLTCLVQAVARNAYARQRDSSCPWCLGGSISLKATRYQALGFEKDLFGAAWTYADSKHAAPDGETTAYMNAFGRNLGRGRGTLMITRTF